MPLPSSCCPGSPPPTGAATLLSAALVAMNLVLTLYFQQVLGYSPFYTGLAFLPHGLAAAVRGPGAGASPPGSARKTCCSLGTSLVLCAWACWP